MNQPSSVREDPQSVPQVLTSDIEKITMQNWVRRLGRTARLTVYYQLIGAIHDKLSGDEVRLLFKNAASNEEFMQLLGSEVYGASFAHAVLLRLEESAQDISVTNSFHGSLTIENILPKAMKDEYWIRRFGPDEHLRWLNRLGNLAMLSGSKNSRAQYYDFDRKKGIYNYANQQVSFDLTKEVCAESEWNISAIQKRHQRLLELAGATWSI
ncbi:HNH endonuclease family protein [Methylobacterium sp. Leaf465]|uniref:HNH endonuclease family protein n=1 Tax=Methylobacterium sp. Leaf465 TaxID=1736385 RepID=UPI0009E9A0E7|nr:HNH endonuclease family protein [Methylobacterium sp. Leaf465]